MPFYVIPKRVVLDVDEEKGGDTTKTSGWKLEIVSTGFVQYDTDPPRTFIKTLESVLSEDDIKDNLVMNEYNEDYVIGVEE